jgi:hypothetical protein
MQAGRLRKVNALGLARRERAALEAFSKVGQIPVEGDFLRHVERAEVALVLMVAAFIGAELFFYLGAVSRLGLGPTGRRPGPRGL